MIDAVVKIVYQTKCLNHLKRMLLNEVCVFNEAQWKFIYGHHWDTFNVTDLG